MLDSLLGYIPECRGGIAEVSRPHARETDFDRMITVIDLFEAELLCETEDWQRIADLVGVSLYP